jgi:lipopolysaccharide export system protein LptA
VSRRPVFQLSLLALLLVTAGVPRALALPTDRNQAIEIAANRALRDDRAGFTVYTGDVVLTQGSLHIEADRLTIFHEREAADRVVAEGSPARLSQQPAEDEPLVHASARRIVYIKSLERVLLTEAAQIEQDGALVSGDSIEYLMAEQRVRADASSDSGGDRVQVIIPAEVVEPPPATDSDGGA